MDGLLFAFFIASIFVAARAWAGSKSGVSVEKPKRIPRIWE